MQNNFEAGCSKAATMDRTKGTMDNPQCLSISLSTPPTPPISAVRLRPPAPAASNRLRLPPATATSTRVQLPPAPLQPSRTLGKLVAISPQKLGRSNYPLGPFSVRRTKTSRRGKTRSFEERHPTEDDVEDLRDEEATLLYADYLEHMESGAIGFFRLHGEVYVVQGWDGKQKVPKVRLTLPFNVFLWILQLNRTNGTIYIVQTWATTWQSFASARQSTQPKNAFIRSFSKHLASNTSKFMTLITPVSFPAFKTSYPYLITVL